MWDKIITDLLKLPAIIFIFLIPSCFVGLLFWKRLNPAFRVLVVFLWFDLLIEIGARAVVWFSEIQNNLPLLHLYTLGELTLLLLFFRLLHKNSHLLSRYFVGIFSVSAFLVLSNSLFVQDLFSFNSYAKTFVQVVVILLALDYAFQFLNNKEDGHFFKTPEKKVNTAILVYYPGSLFIFMFSQYAQETWQEGYQTLWDINVVLNAIFHFFVLIALCQAIRPHSTS
jgi:hypothetical protein